MTYQSVKIDGYLSEALSDKESIYSLSDDYCSETLDDALRPEIKVIILESSDAMLALLKSEIEKDKNIKVVGMARNAHEARKMVIALDPDLLIMDIMDPHSGGIEFLKRLNKFSPRPVILFTQLSKIPSHLALSAFKEGATDLIDKDTLVLLDSSSLSEDFVLSRKIRATIPN
ncbi:MAG: response regulator [bacterium]